jgi:ABC-type histidine transport system ATPase subunit
MTAAPTLAIHVQGLEKSYKELHVLRGVDFDVPRGSIFAFARVQRSWQDHDREDPVHAAQG